MQNKKTTPFDQLYDEIQRNQTLLEKGNKTFLTLEPIFPRFSKVFPGFIKGDYVLISAQTSVGKSKFVWHLTNSFLKYKDFDVHVLYNALEETNVKIASGFILNYLNKRGKKMSFYNLLNYKNSPHDAQTMGLIKEAVDLFNDQLASNYRIYQETVPSQFYRRVVEYLSTLGKFYYAKRDKNNNLISKTEVDYKKEWNHFEYNNPNTFVISVSDHLWNYNSEKGKTKRESVGDFSRYYCRNKLCIQAGCIVINVQQQENATDNTQYTNKGKAIADKYVPRLKSLAEFKNTPNDATIAFGLFSPFMYVNAWPKHNFYDIKEMGDNYRALYPLKTREAQQLADAKSVPLLFDGSQNYFEELPKDVEKGMIRFKEYFKK